MIFRQSIWVLMLEDMVVGACGDVLIASTSLMKSEACSLVEIEVEEEDSESFREKREYKILAQETGCVSENEESLQGNTEAHLKSVVMKLM